MQTPLSAILVVLATVTFSSTVITCATTIFDQTYVAGNQQLGRLPELNLELLNQTSDPYNPELFNQTKWLPLGFDFPELPYGLP